MGTTHVSNKQNPHETKLISLKDVADPDGVLRDGDLLVYNKSLKRFEIVGEVGDVILKEKTATPTKPKANRLRIYAQSDRLYTIDESGTAYGPLNQDATAAQKGLMTAAYASKLDGIEASADVTDATNVTAAGALMKDGSVALTSDWDAGGHTIRALKLHADEAAAAPLVIGSTALVANLNAQLLGGKTSSQFVVNAGQPGGQTVYGGTMASNNLILKSTSHATKGTVTIGDEGDIVLGGSNLIALIPDTDEKVDIGSSSKRINELHVVSIVPKTAPTYTPSNVTPDWSYDADTVAIAELADVVGTLIADLQALGVLS